MAAPHLSWDGTVETERLVLRPWDRSDLEPLAVVFARPEVWWFPFRRGFSQQETEDFLTRKIETWQTRGWSQWAVEHKDDRRLIGFLGLEPPAFLPEVMPTVEIGWRLDPDYWHRGLASEGARAGLRFGFDVLDLPEIVSIYEPDNTASGRVMERIGMHLDRDTTHPGLGVPLRVYRLTAAEWRAGG